MKLLNIIGFAAAVLSCVPFVGAQEASDKAKVRAYALFEDNAEHGLGIHLGQKTIRNRLIGYVEEMAASDKASDEFKAAAKAYLDSKDDGKVNEAAAKALIPELEKAAAEGCPVAPKILADPRGMPNG